VLEFYSKARNKGLAIIYSDEAKNASIIGDRYILGQIFSNLIENAIKYTASGEVKVLLQNINNQTAVSVIDTGIGISKEYISNLFTPFSQEEFGYTRRYEGTGLGLALVKKYVEILDAQIDVESEKDKGSTFRVIFNTANNFKV
jgi:signal transduction histidine kinase